MNTSHNPLRLDTSDLGSFGSGLTRPECVWIDSDGIWASDNSLGGVINVSTGHKLGSGIVEPNGFSRRQNGTFVVAGLVDHRVYEIAPDGTTRVLAAEVDGRPLGVVNCATVDHLDRVWVSVMTDRANWHDAFGAGPEGYIVRIDRTGVHRVAGGLHLTNEVKLGPDRRYLYAAESLARRIVRFPIQEDGSLGPRELVGPADLGHGAFPDGFAFDAEGRIWVTLITRNALAFIDQAGQLHTVYEEANAAALDRLMEAFNTGKATRELMAGCIGSHLKLPTSIAFGGKDGGTAYVGSLAGTTLATFAVPS
jgi:sugar lactone lactonase YvrE